MTVKAFNVVSPVTVRVVSSVVSSLTFNLPLTVVIIPSLEIFTTPPSVANDVAPDELSVEALVSPVIVNDPLVEERPPVSMVTSALKVNLFSLVVP